MAIVDQFETESLTTYSGTYVDDIIFGDTFTTDEVYFLGYTPLGENDPKSTRRVIGSRVTQDVASAFNSLWAPFWLRHGFASGTMSGRPQRFLKTYTDGEFYFDSFMPSPVDIHVTNGFVPTEGQTTEIRRQGTTSVTILSAQLSGSKFDILPATVTNLGIGFAGYPYRKISSDEDTIVDTLWRDKFPYESKYKNLQRLFKFSNILPKTYTFNRRLDGVSISSSLSNVLGTIVRWSERHLNLNISPFTTGANPINIAGFMNVPTLNNATENKIGLAPARDIYNLYFGIGNGQTGGHKSGQVDNTASPPLGNDASIRGPFIQTREFSSVFDVGDTVIPRGYKYGIRSVAPERTVAIYRHGRYGQVRDMLEQRPYSKFLLRNRGIFTSEPAVSVRFISGTLTHARSVDYITAANPSYNLTDSGIYDLEYKSGQPFFDTR